MLGIGLYGLTYLYPLYLAQIRGYNALMIGEALFVTGLAQFATALIAGRLMTRLDLHHAGGGLRAVRRRHLVDDLAHPGLGLELLWPQIFRGVGLMLAFIPINNISLGTLPAERVKNASGLYNLTRNPRRSASPASTTILNDQRPAPRAPARGGDLVASCRAGSALTTSPPASTATAATRRRWRSSSSTS